MKFVLRLVDVEMFLGDLAKILTYEYHTCLCLTKRTKVNGGMGGGGYSAPIDRGIGLKSMICLIQIKPQPDQLLHTILKTVTSLPDLALIWFTSQLPLAHEFTVMWVSI